MKIGAVVLKLCVLMNPKHSDMGIKKAQPRSIFYTPSSCRPYLPTKTKLLCFTHLDYVVNLPKRHLRSSRFTRGRIWPLYIGLSFLPCSETANNSKMARERTRFYGTLMGIRGRAFRIRYYFGCYGTEMSETLQRPPGNAENPE